MGNPKESVTRGIGKKLKRDYKRLTGETRGKQGYTERIES